MKTHTDWAAVGAPDWLGEERLLEQFLDSENHVGEKFFLYYFVSDPTKTKTKPKTTAAKPTLLFVAGGPGEINRVRNENFGDLAGYRTVYFHLRGAGFSQLPSNKSYDKYLRGKYAVEDMEAIRRDLLGEKGKWHGIVAHSYGTVLAQQYAHRYPEHVGKLVLSASLSRHQLQTIDEAPQIEETLTRIYQSERFAFLDNVKSPAGQDTRSFLVKSAMTIADRGEQQFGNLQFVVDEYPQLQSRLRLVGLEHPREFFAALRRLRHIGWLYHSGDLAKGASDNVDEVQQYTGLIIAAQIFQREQIDFKQPLNNQPWSLVRFDTPNSANKYAGERATSTLIKNAKEYFKAARASSHRAYYVMSIFDGINVTFLTEYLAHGDLRKAIRKIGGLQHEEKDVNPFLDTVGITDEPITPWDPRQYPHKVPTLILKGGADPVTRGDQAERYLTEGLTGERMLMEFSGVGHSMSLPQMADGGPGGGQTRDFLLRSFFKGTFEKFNHSDTINVVRNAFADVENKPPNNLYGVGVEATFVAEKNAAVKL